MNGVQTRFKCKLDVKRCKRFVFPPSSLLPRSNALKTKAIRYFQTDRTLTRIVSPPLYTPKSALTNQWSSLAFGIGMVIVPLIYPFGLRIRRAVILSPEVLSTILIICGALLLLMTFFSIRKARVLAAQGGTITVDKGRVTYPEVNKNKIEYNSFLISDINYIKDDDEENQFKVSLPDKYIIFEIKYFASQEDFDEFRSLFN